MQLCFCSPDCSGSSHARPRLVRSRYVQFVNAPKTVPRICAANISLGGMDVYHPSLRSETSWSDWNMAMSLVSYRNASQLSHPKHLKVTLGVSYGQQQVQLTFRSACRA